MRIAIFSWESLHSIAVGGIAAHVTELAAALERRGHEVHVFTRMGHGQKKYERIEGVHYHRCPFDLHPDFIREVDNMCGSFVHHYIETENFVGPFDVLHAHDWLTAKALVWAKNARGRKSIITLHSTEFGRCGNRHCGGRSSSICAREWEGLYVAERVVAVSRAMKREVCDIYRVPEGKVRVVYNGVNPHHFDGWIDPASVKARYAIGPLDPTVLFCGRMTWQKGPDILLQGIPFVLKFHPSAKFLFAGDGDMRAGLESRAREMRVAHATRFLGQKTGSDLIDLFRAVDLVCVPSRNEPFGIVILEAWSAGKPVVASRNGGPDEFVWHGVNGLMIYDNPDSVAWGVGTLFNNFDYARWLGHNGRIAVESAFTWDAVADQTLTVYQE